NNSVSKDEQYLACLIECAVCGTTDPDRVTRPKVQRILQRHPKLSARIALSRREAEDGRLIWIPETARVQNVVMKLARGHAAYEHSGRQCQEPELVQFMPLETMPAALREEFETPPDTGMWPEIGSRAFLRACGEWDDPFTKDGWQVVQE